MSWLVRILLGTHFLSSWLGRLLLESQLLSWWIRLLVISFDFRRILIRRNLIHWMCDCTILFIYTNLIWLGKLNHFILILLFTLPTFIYFISYTKKCTYTNTTTHTPSYFTTQTIRWWSRWAAITRSLIWWWRRRTLTIERAKTVSKTRGWRGRWRRLWWGGLLLELSGHCERNWLFFSILNL